MRKLRRRGADQVPPQPPAHQRQEDREQGHAYLHPVDKAVARAGGLLVDLHEHEIGRRADGRAEAADAGAVGNGEDQRRVQAAIGIGFQDRERHRQQHQGGGGVRDPHADQASRGGETVQQRATAATAEGAHHAEREAAMGAAAFQRTRQHEAAAEQQDQFVAIALRHLLGIEYSHQREQGQGQQGRDRCGHRLEHPPQRAPRGDGERGREQWRSALRKGQATGGDGKQGREPETRAADRMQGGGRGGGAHRASYTGAAFSPPDAASGA